MFDDGGEHAAFARSLAQALVDAGASVRRVTLVAPRAAGGRAFEGAVEVLRCPALLDAAPRVRELVGGRGPLGARVPSVHVWRSLLALAPADRVVVVGAATPLATGLRREHPRALVVDVGDRDLRAAAARVLSG